jgi:hypothetical protein
LTSRTINSWIASGSAGFDEVEVAQLFGRGQVGYLALVDGVCGRDDPALGRLPEDLGQADDRHRAGRDQVGQDRAGPDRGKLIRVTDQNDTGLRRHGAEELMAQHDIDHRRFVQHEQIALQPVLLVAFELARRRIEFQ